MASEETRYNNHYVPDLPALISSGGRYPTPRVIQLRSILESITENHYEPFLWVKPEGDGPCRNPSQCRYPDYRRDFQIIADSDYPDLWFTPLPSDYNTGVYKELQYVPRINTTVTYTNMTAAEWPSECVRDKEGVFFAEYHSRRPRAYDIDLTACMPTNISDTPWQATHTRQDIT